MRAGLAKFLRGGRGRIKKTTPRPISLPAPSPSTSRFFSLPLELRIQIYYYALLHPREGTPISPDNIHVICRKGNRYDYGWRSDWWGSERMTRLLRVNAQIYYEATEVLYTRFTFLFNCHMSTVRTFLDPFSPRVCSLVRWLSLLLTLDMRSLDLAQDRGKKLYDGNPFAVLALRLPDLRGVNLLVSFVGDHPSDTLRDYLVEQALNYARPFRRVPSLVLENDDEVGWPHRAEVVQRCRERIQAGTW